MTCVSLEYLNKHCGDVKEEATSGEICFDGKPVTKLSPKDRDAAHVLQDHATMHDNLAFALKTRKSPKDESKGQAQQVAGLLGIEQLVHCRSMQLSRDQRHRVAPERALILNAAVFLMDEPLSDTVVIGFEPDILHYFDGATGNRITA